MSDTNERKPYAVGHKDGKLTNNRVNNLEWITMPIDVYSSSLVVDEDRSLKDIQKYEKEAFDKVWLMRTHPEENRVVEEARRRNIERILDTYHDIPKDGYTEWECGYWNGIMGALRWVMGTARDFLDT